MSKNPIQIVVNITGMFLGWMSSIQIVVIYCIIRSLGPKKAFENAKWKFSPKPYHPELWYVVLSRGCRSTKNVGPTSGLSSFTWKHGGKISTASQGLSVRPNWTGMKFCRVVCLVNVFQNCSNWSGSSHNEAQKGILKMQSLKTSETMRPRALIFDM